MKVLQINSFFSVGGPPRIMNGIYDTLKENGIECKIAASREKLYALEDSYQVCSDKNVKINALKARLFDNEGFNAQKDTQKLVEYIKQYDPDIIHLHNLHGYCINLEVLFGYLKSCQKPVVWTLHDCWAFTGHCAHFDLIGCSKWKEQCRSCSQTKEYPASFFHDRSEKNYKEKKAAYSGMKNLTLVTPSKWLASFLPDSILKEHAVKVIHNGIDLKRFSCRKSDILEKNGLAGKRIVLGVAQNWAERKGLEDFVKLASLLSDEYKVVLIGLTEEQKKALPKEVFGLTRTENVEELQKWYSAAEVFVNFTYQDNFPTVNIEALACGTPVLTYKTGGSVEAVCEGCGWVVAQGNVKGAKKVIEEMGEKEQYREACLQRAQKFDRKERYLEYIELYKSLLKGNL